MNELSVLQVTDAIAPTTTAFMQLNSALGPVGAVCAFVACASGIANWYLVKRIFTLYEARNDADKADAAASADLRNGFSNMESAFKELSALIRNWRP